MGCAGSKKVGDEDTEERLARNREVAAASTKTAISAVEVQHRASTILQTVEPNAEIGKQLVKVPLLSRLTDKERATLGGAMILVKFDNGKPVFAQGDPGSGFYVIKSGAAAVLHTDNKGVKAEIGTLKDGDYFGETALLNDAPRGATVVARGKLEVYYLQKNVFSAMFDDKNASTNVKFAKRRIAVSSEQNNNAESQIVNKANTKAAREKSKAVRQVLLTAIQDNILFENMDESARVQVVNEMYKVNFNKGESPIRQGDPGNSFYVVQSGDFDVFIEDKKAGTKVKVAACSAGSCFGELALMYNAPRAATVTAVSSAVVWVVDRFVFRRIAKNLGEKRLQEYASQLAKIDLLAPLSTEERIKIAEAIEEVTFKPKKAIFKEGDEGDAMYLVLDGDLLITKGDKLLMTAKTGDFFGERALLTNEPRAATVTVGDKTAKLAKLDRVAFSLLLGPLEDIMNQTVEGYKKVVGTPLKEGGTGTGSSQQNTTKAKQAKVVPETKVNREDLKIVGTLGKGSFGHVHLVQHKTSKKTYALKQVQKQQIVDTCQQAHIMSEKKVMAALVHPFLIRLYQTYQDHDCLYFLLEVCMGGEMFTVLRKRRYFEEDVACFYAACVTLGFEYMHSMDIVYRDLKPENLLINQDGFLKITDFGFAKFLTGRTWTTCGTPDYLAPEIVSNMGHGKGVDWWTLGVLIYEMIASVPPFYDDVPMKIYNKIMHGSISFPSYFSKDVVSLIKKLLNRKPTKRLGVVRGGATLVKSHPWFASIKWDDLYNMKGKGPIIPDIKDQFDLSNFDDYDGEDNRVMPFVDDGTDWYKEF